MPLLVLLSVLPVTLLAELSKGRDSPYALYALAAVIMVFMYYHPVAMEDRLTSQLSIIREDRFVKDFLREHGDKNILVICGRPGQLIVDNYGAVSFNTANREKNVFWHQYKNHLYDTIYAVQSISYKTKSPLKDNVLDAAYQLKPVSSLQITGGYFLQISRVKM